MKKLQETDVIRGKRVEVFEGEIVYGSRYVRIKSLNRYLFG